MTQYQIVYPDNQTWNAFVANHPQAHVLQLSQWGQLKSAFGWQAEQVALVDDHGVIVAGTSILYRALPLGIGTMAYLPKGPLCPADWWTDPAQMNQLWEAIHTTARKRGARWLKVEAPDMSGMPDAEDKAPIEALLNAGFRLRPQTIQPPRTVAIDLSPETDDILKAMKQKTRYNVRLSAKKDVVVRQGNSADVASFNAMMAVTGERDQFGVHDPHYFQRAFDLFTTEGHAALFIASYEGKDLAGIMVFALGDYAWYLYGASTNEERNRMPTYGAQWAAIQWAKAQGCIVYDMWGVPDEDEATLEAQFTECHDGLWGVYRTKRGWGGRVVRRVPAYDYVYSKPIYALYQLVLARRG